MRPPDKIPGFKPATFKPGDDVYLWTGSGYSGRTVVGVHDWKNALTVQDGIGKMQVGGHEVISAEQFANEKREEARDKYRHIIGLWERGVRKSKLMAEELEKNPRAIGQMIAAAKRWNLLTPDDPKPSDSNSSASG